MKSKPELLERVLDSLNPFKYRVLRQHVLKNAFRHFLIILAFGVLLSGFIYIPQFFGYVDDVKIAYASVETLQLNPVIATSEPVTIGELVIDTEEERSPNASKLYVSNELFYYDYGTKVKSLREMGDVKEIVGKLITSLPVLIIVLIPSFLVASYIFVGVAFILLILIMALLLKALMLNMKKEKRISFKELFSIGLYASIFLCLGLITQAFGTSLGYYLGGVFVIYFLIAALQKPEKHKKMDDLGDQ
jgi:hypothetical protein